MIPLHRNSPVSYTHLDVYKRQEKGYAYLDQGALVVDVKEETDTKEIPPCMKMCIRDRYRTVYRSNWSRDFLCAA